jgi:hypothetical protein
LIGVEPGPEGIEIPPVGMPRPACIRSRTSWLVPARRFWFESEISVAVSFSVSAF